MSDTNQLFFVKTEDEDKNIYAVYPKQTTVSIGLIRFPKTDEGSYIFFPEPNMTFTKSILKEILNFMEKGRTDG